MLPLHEAQNNFIVTINDGPAWLNPDLFDGPHDRILLGLRAHANTVSHARLVALEDTFPLTRTAMGEAEFNILSRRYCETPEARRLDSNGIGCGLPDFLRAHDFFSAISDLAKIEWAWLESYNAADHKPLSIGAISSHSSDDLLALNIGIHPAARLVALSMSPFAVIAELGTVHETALLITRPELSVSLTPADDITHRLFNAATNGCTICNLIEITVEEDNEAGPMAPILTLIGAGALIITE